MRSRVQKRLLMLSVVPLLTSPAFGAGASGQVTDLSAQLLQIATAKAAPTQSLFDAAAPFGFTPQAADTANLSIHVPPRPVVPAKGVTLPLGLVFDADFAGLSAEAMTSINKAQGDLGGSAIYFESGPVFNDELDRDMRFCHGL